jgi:DNA-directed RNA polymerase subunit RPC12/RpoP
MGDISISCPGCSQPLEAPEEMAGETLPCPSCGAEMVIPGSVVPASAGDGTTCPKCKAKLVGGAVLCVQCGLDLRNGHVIDTKIK